MDDLERFLGLFDEAIASKVKGGELYCQNGNNDIPYKNQAIKEGSIVTVKLDAEFNVSLLVNSEDWGNSISQDSQGSFQASAFSCGILL